MKATVGIITHNRAETLFRCIESIEKQTVKPHEIIIVDTSDRKLKLKRSMLKITYIHLKNRIRQPAARNMILEKTKTEIIAYLDDDTVVKETWLENILEGYSIAGNVAAVCGPAINCDSLLRPLLKFDHSPRNRNYFTSYGDVREKTRCWVPPHPVKCSAMLGANMSYKASLLRDAGGFVSFYTEGYGFREENFPQVRLIRSGYTFVYMPEAFVWHVKERSGGADIFNDHFYLCGRNHRIFADAFFPKWKSRLSWIFWSISPPCIWLCILLALKKRDISVLKWHKGLWGS